MGESPEDEQVLHNAMGPWIHESHLYPISSTQQSTQQVVSYGCLSGTPLCLVSV